MQKLAEELAQKENSADRKAELLKIAEVCHKVPKQKAENFYEAVQSVWFAYMCVMLENWGTGNTLLHIDQYLYPYYVMDQKKETADEQKIFELVSMLLLNCNSACVVYSEHRSHGFAGNNSGCSFTIGGITPDGDCAVNELSYVFLEAERAVNMVSDDLVIRISENTPDEFLY